jgi:hypothetical protein
MQMLNVPCGHVPMADRHGPQAFADVDFSSNLAITSDLSVRRRRFLIKCGYRFG